MRAMLTVELPTCFNCLRLRGERTMMEQIGEHTFHCQSCNATKELVVFPIIRNGGRRHYALWFLSGKVVASGIAIGSTIFSAMYPALARVPASEIVAPLMFAGYLVVALRATIQGFGGHV